MADGDITVFTESFLAAVQQRLSDSPVRLATGPPEPSTPVIDIYIQPEAARPQKTDGAIAVLFPMDTTLAIWPLAGGGTLVNREQAWSLLLGELEIYLDLRWPAEQLWTYARYHCDTTSNIYAPCFWEVRYL